MKVSKKVVLGGVLLVLVFGVLFFRKNRWFSYSDVAKHSTASSCWSVVNGVVYDFSALLTTHTGGENSILPVCGTDGSSLFNKRHGTQSFPKSELEKYRIGTVHL